MAQLLLVAGLAASSGCDSPGARVDAVLRSYVDLGRIPGVVAMAASGETVFYEAAFGNGRRDPDEAMEIDDILWVYSMTAPVTSVAVMQLVEQGEIELDAELGDYLIEYSRPEVLEGFDQEGKPLMRDASRSPTIRELLANTSGYAYNMWNRKLRRYPLSFHLPAGRYVYEVLPLTHEPGVQWQYGPNAGYLGILIEVVSGLDLEEYFRRHIFDPLGMNDSYFQLPEEKKGRQVQSRLRYGDGGFDRPVSAPAPPRSEPWDEAVRSSRFSKPRPQMSWFAGDGGLKTTAPDYIRFVRALLNGGELDGARILAADTVALMAMNQIGELEAFPKMVRGEGGAIDLDTHPRAEHKFGLGFFLAAEPTPEGPTKGAMVWTGLTNGYFWIDRDKDVAGVVLTPIAPFADAEFLQMAREYEKAIYAAHR